MFRFILLSAALLIAVPPALGQQPDKTDASKAVADLMSLSEAHFRKGESCFSSGNMECARREFDVAIDIVIDSGVDVRSDASLLTRWRQLVEKIENYQASALADVRANAWKTQEYAGKPEAQVPESDALAENETASGPLSIPVFQEKFQELKSLFREKYSRELVTTGADHEEHRRLYGSGSAYDVRVRDLSAEQIAFVITTGQRLGLHVKDFSTPQKVAAHNARVVSLRLPSDTLATNVHIHIDRNTPGPGKGYVTEPVSKRSWARGAAGR
ncbi:MAG TPA: hypothetical protein VLZ81_01495 [Blastocatellia bacterium]|nr:hypothetical protein [Blastocatellia bacterium]